MERRLAAILSADVVGYSRLAAHDETATLSALGSLRRNIIDPVVRQHNGRVVKTMGDGVLVEFQSAVAAVECALEWQERSADAQVDLSPSHRLLFRIGVNLGEVVVEGSDILGDGVNVAARLEGEAIPGGVCISEDVQRQIRGKVATHFEDGGERRLKNMPRPVRVFQTGVPGLESAGTDGAPYQATLFGNFRFSGPNGPIEISARKLRGLLSCLTVTHPVPQSREQLMTLFWGSHLDKQARQNLRQAIARLKRLLGPDVLEIGDDTIALRAGQVTSDVERLVRALEGPSPDALRAISEIESCELLADLPIAEESWTEWLGNERSRQRDRLVGATVRLGGLELAEGNFEDALNAAERALEFDPHREDAFRIAVQALVGLGRDSSAVARFAQFRRRLDDDLGAAPSDETHALMASLGAKPAGDRVGNVAPAAGPTIPDEPSLAVVPFRNITGDERADIIGSGLAEDIVTTLAKISSILVVARASTQGYQGDGADWQTISREQGVRYLVEGAIRLVGDRVRVTAHLRDATSGREIWADRFDRWFRNFLDIQDEIAKEVVSALQVQLTDGEQARIWARGTDDTKAWENVVVATELIHAHHRDGIAKARVLAEEAVRLETVGARAAEHESGRFSHEPDATITSGIYKRFQSISEAEGKHT